MYIFFKTYTNFSLSYFIHQLVRRYSGVAPIVKGITVAAILISYWQ